MEKLLNKGRKRSLFDGFSEKNNNEESTSALSNNREMMNIDDENSSIVENMNLNKHECEAKAMEKLLNKGRKRSLFDGFSEKNNNEESTSALSNNREMMNIDDENSSIVENMNLNKHECEAKAMEKLPNKGRKRSLFDGFSEKNNNEESTTAHSNNREMMNIDDENSSIVENMNLNKHECEAKAMEKLPYKGRKRSLFDGFSEKNNNEESTSALSNNREMMNIDDENSSIVENMNLNKHECEAKAMEKLPNKGRKRSLFDGFSEKNNNEESTSALSINRETMNIYDENSSIDENMNLNKHECDSKLKAFGDAFETVYGFFEANLIQVLQIIEEFNESCIDLVNSVETQINPAEVEKLKSKFHLLENKYLNTINNLQLEVTKLKLQLEQQSAFSCLIGSTFCYSLSKATRTSSAVDMILQEDSIKKLAQLITKMFSSFIQGFNNKMPSIKTNEMKFVLHMLRIVANLSTTESGCHFLSQVNDGINIVNLVVSLVLYTPPSHGILKKIAYTTLYNVSNKFDGHLLMENNKLIQTLNNDIKLVPSKGNNNIILLSLNLLHSLTEKINKSMYTILKNEINLQEILKLTRYTETESTARKIFNNINIASEKYNESE